MNAASVIVLALVLAAAVAAVVFMVHRSRKAGSSACSGCALNKFCMTKRG